MTMSPDQEALIGRVFETYLKDHHHEDIRQLIADTNEETHRPVLVNAMTLFEANMEVMTMLRICVYIYVYIYIHIYILGLSID